MPIITSPAEGMRDFSPAEVRLRNYVASRILEVYHKYGFVQIETPCADRIELFSGGEGGENEKMLFKILKRGEKLDLSQGESQLADLALRYDLTVPLCRFYAANRAKLPNPFKVIQMGSVWRAERPQKGRFRQFTQCDIDIIGQSSILAEIELITATAEALLALGFRGFTIRINDRRILTALATQAGFAPQEHSRLLIVFDKLDKIGLDGVADELTQSGFESQSIERFMSFARLAPQIKDIEALRQLLPDLEPEVCKGLEGILQTVSVSGFELQLDISLVRGMGYYTGPIFEAETPGYRSSIAGGGRYDKMIAKILQSKENIPACGFSIGFERVVQILESQGFVPPVSGQKIALLYDKSSTAFVPLLRCADELRNRFSVVSLQPAQKNRKAQLEKLVEQGFTGYALYAEGEEVAVRFFE